MKTAEWYKQNLGFIIVRQGNEPNFTTFVSDPNGKMMFEFFKNEDYPMQNFKDWNFMSIHIAFHCNDIVSIKNKLLEAGAVVSEELKKTDSGDQVMMLRDPWGLPIQFVQRIKPMLNHEGLFFEHIAFNLIDSRKVAKWYNNNLGMLVMREGTAPNYGIFISDSPKGMMFELYQNKDFPVIKFEDVSHMSIHLAFMAEDIEAVKKQLLVSGAKIVEDTNKTPAGDIILMMHDPWGLSIQFVKRMNQMIK
jgi:uncharacterized glyoxalase superfamily protein PhnB